MQNLFGLSVYSSALVVKNLELFARFDQPEANTISGYAQSWYYLSLGSEFIIGIHHNPTQGINISLNYQVWRSKDNNLNFKNRFLLSFEYKL